MWQHRPPPLRLVPSHEDWLHIEWGRKFTASRDNARKRQHRRRNNQQRPTVKKRAKK